MIFRVNSEFAVWLPVYTLNDFTYQTVFYKFLLLMECLLSLFAFIFTATTVYIVSTSQAFHRNLNSLIASIISSWLLSLIGRALLTPYLVGIWTAGGISSEFRFWWTDDVAEMAPIRTMREAWPLFLGGALTWYYMFIMVTCLFILSLERTCASFFISNYEKTSRSYVCIVLIAFHHCMVLTMTYICFWNRVHFAPAISFCIGVNVLAVLIFWGNNRYNRKLIRKFEKKKENVLIYSLPVKFQAKENIRSFNLTLRVIVCGFILIFAAISCIIALTYKVFPSLATFLVYTSENIIHLNPLLVCPVLVFSVSTWSKALLHSRVHWIRKITDITFIDLPVVPIPERGANLQQRETDAYFSQLQNSWERRIRQ